MLREVCEGTEPLRTGPAGTCSALRRSAGGSARPSVVPWATGDKCWARGLCPGGPAPACPGLTGRHRAPCLHPQLCPTPLHVPWFGCWGPVGALGCCPMATAAPSLHSPAGHSQDQGRTLSGSAPSWLWGLPREPPAHPSLCAAWGLNTAEARSSPTSPKGAHGWGFTWPRRSPRMLGLGPASPAVPGPGDSQPQPCRTGAGQGRPGAAGPQLHSLLWGGSEHSVPGERDEPRPRAPLGVGPGLPLALAAALTASRLQTISCCCSVNAKQTFLSLPSLKPKCSGLAPPLACPPAPGPPVTPVSTSPAGPGNPHGARGHQGPWGGQGTSKDPGTPCPASPDGCGGVSQSCSIPCLRLRCCVQGHRAWGRGEQCQGLRRLRTQSWGLGDAELCA